MTRQDQIYKWFCYALALLPVWILDRHVLGYYPLFGCVPTLLPVTVAVVAVLEGAAAGAGFGMGVGLLWAYGYPGQNAVWILGLTLAGMACGGAAQYALTQGFFGCMLCSAACLGGVGLLRVLWGAFIQLAPPEVLLRVAAGEFFSSLLWSPAIYLLFRVVFRRVGRNKLA